MQSGTDNEDQTKSSKLNLFTLRELNRLFSNQSAFGPMKMDKDKEPELHSRVARDVTKRPAARNPYFVRKKEKLPLLGNI